MTLNVNKNLLLNIIKPAIKKEAVNTKHDISPLKRANLLEQSCLFTHARDTEQLYHSCFVLFGLLDKCKSNISFLALFLVSTITLENYLAV